MVWLPLLACGLLGRGAPALARWLSPKALALTLTGAAVIATTCWAYSLGLLAATIAGRVPGLADLGHWSPQVLRAGDPVAPAIGLTAALVLVLVVVAAVVAGGRRARALIAAERLIRTHRDTTLVVLTDPTPDAYAIGGLTGGRVAVSTGMLAALEPDERAALLAHEHAHVNGRHHLLRLTVGLAAAINPVLRQIPAVVETATERWADERAATVVGDRRVVARALSRAALATLGASPHAHLGEPLAPFHRCDVPDRVSALLTPAPRSRRLPVLAVAMLAGGVIVATLAASHDMEVLFEHAGRVYLSAH